MTKRRKIFVIIPVAIVALLLIYTWIIFLTTSYIAVINHYLGLILFIPVVYFLLKDKSFKKTLLSIGIYLVLGLINLLSFLPVIITNSIGLLIGSTHIYSPAINCLSLVILIVYGILNFDTLVDLYLDYNEAKGKL